MTLSTPSLGDGAAAAAFATTVTACETVVAALRPTNPNIEAAESGAPVQPARTALAATWERRVQRCGGGDVPTLRGAFKRARGRGKGWENRRGAAGGDVAARV